MNFNHNSKGVDMNAEELEQFEKLIIRPLLTAVALHAVISTKPYTHTLDLKQVATTAVDFADATIAALKLSQI